jgi:hypothetical protein
MKRLKQHLIYHIGIDPGMSNLGLSIVNLSTKNAVAKIIDVSTWGNEKHKIVDDDLGDLMNQVVKSLESVFELTERVSIERQPPFGTRRVLMCACYLEQSIRALFPHVQIVKVAPQSYRAWWKTKVKKQKGWSDEKIHRENKKESGRLEKNVFSKSEMERSRILFSKKSVYHVDAVEATQLCVYGIAHPVHEMECPKQKTFSTITMVSKIYGPSS